MVLLTPVPLVVDLDGTLLRSDSLIESLLVLARTRPLALLALPLWLRRGRASMKQRLARLALPDVDTLPYRSDLLAHLAEEKRHGRTLVLATGADERVADAIATQLGLFDAVLASDGQTNLSGERKAERLIARFGVHGFDYVGSGRADLPVWCAARGAIVVSASRRLIDRVAQTTPVQRTFDASRPPLTSYLQTLRPLHWIKNTLVLLPLAAAYPQGHPQLIWRALLAFVAFSLCASSVYLLNDLLDLRADRRHPHKKARKLASGEIPLLHALLLLPVLLLVAFWLGAGLPRPFVAVLGAYFALMTAYSLGLKDIPLFDVLLLAGGYALRVVAGAIAVGVHASGWLLAVCVLLFLSLALVKRYAELMLMDTLPGERRARGYRSGDKPLVFAQGVASGYLSVLLLVLSTYAETAAQPYARRALLWIACALLLGWVNVMWFAATRGRMHHDPVVFALTDRASLALLFASGIVSAIALFGV